MPAFHEQVFMGRRDKTGGDVMGCDERVGSPLSERGENVAGIQFTAQGTAAPKLISVEIRARRRVAGMEAFEYEVRLTYLNRIQQMEWATLPIRFERRGDRWEKP